MPTVNAPGAAEHARRNEKKDESLFGSWPTAVFSRKINRRGTPSVQSRPSTRTRRKTALQGEIGPHMKTNSFTAVLIGTLCAAVAATASSKQNGAGTVDVSTLLVAEADALGVRRNTNVRQDAIDIVRLDSKHAILLQEAPQNRKNNVARIIRLSDGCELREKLIAVHALNDGGFDTVDAMQTYRGRLVAFAGTNAEIVVWDVDQ
jgi:hypothetical protein